MFNNTKYVIKKCILLIESEKGACEDLKALIVRHGYEAVVCGDCGKASWLLLNQKFACVVVDLEVGGENGLALISCIKKNRYHLNNKTPFILTSESLEAGLVNRVAGRIDGALLKPFGEAQFMEKVRTLVLAK